MSIEQSVFALASKGATAEQIKQILITDQAISADVEAALAKTGLITATKALNAEEIIELATKKGISSERAKEIASALGLIATEKGQIVSKKQLTVATLKQVGATEAEISAILGLNEAEITNIGITNLLTASFAKLWAIIKAHPIGTVLTVIGAITAGVITYITKTNKEAEKALKEAHENAEKAWEETKASLSEDKSELQSVNSELETTKQKLQEISSIGAPTLAEQNELTKLSTANSQLETQQKLLQNNIKLKEKAAALDAKQLLDTQVEMEYSDIYFDTNSVKTRTESYDYAEHAEYQARQLENAYSLYRKALESGNLKEQEFVQEYIDILSSNSSVLTSELLTIIESFKYEDGTIIEGYEDLYNEYMGMIYNLQSLTNPDIFLDLTKTVTEGTGIDYEQALADAYKLAYEGNFDIESLNKDFVKALTDSGITEDTIEAIFKTKQQEYQILIDRIDSKYNPSTVASILSPNATPEEKVIAQQENETRKTEIEKINKTLKDYAENNPIEFQLLTSYDTGFVVLDKYIEEEEKKAINTTDYVGDYVLNAINRVVEEGRKKLSPLDIEVTPKFNPTTSIASAKEAFSGFESIYDEIMGGGTVSADSINRLTESFGGLNGGLALEHFRNVLTTMPDDIEAQKQALDDLANSYLDQTDLMQNLTEENKDYVISELEKIGVENAEEYVESRLNDTVKQLLSNLSKFSSVYAENYNAIKNAVKGSDEYEQSLQNLKDGLNELLSYEIDGETFTFDVSDDFVVENLSDIEAAANGSVDALNRVRLAATQDYVMNMSLNAPTEAMAEGVRLQINDLIAGFDIDKVQVGTALDDTPLIQGLNHLVDAGQLTRNQMNSILAGIGVTPDIGYEKATFKLPSSVKYSQAANAMLAGLNAAVIQVPKISYRATGKAHSAQYASPSGGSSSGGGGGGSSSSENETKEQFDWVETKIKRHEEAIDRLDKAVNNTYDNWKNRNSALSQEISKVREEIDLQQKAYNRYMQEANNVGLSAEYVDKIKNGKLDIETIKDQDLLDKINLYTEW